MSWTEDARIQSGLTERCFELSGNHGPVPGVYWAPKGAKPAALVLLGHGGTRHKIGTLLLTSLRPNRALYPQDGGVYLWAQ